MNHEFNNRVDAQREILSIVNSLSWHEELHGLSFGGIKRWIDANKIPDKSELLKLILEAADKLFFLANKSQEQITDEYKALSLEVSQLTKGIKVLIEHQVNLALKL